MLIRITHKTLSDGVLIHPRDFNPAVHTRFDGPPAASDPVTPVPLPEGSPVPPPAGEPHGDPAPAINRPALEAALSKPAAEVIDALKTQLSREWLDGMLLVEGAQRNRSTVLKAIQARLDAIVVAQ